MELGNKIKKLRNKASITQEQLAEKLNVTAQAVSKWENGIAMPDITLLPTISETLGVSIDELFDLTAEQKMKRLENRMDMEEELSADTFREYEEFLKVQMNEGDKQRATSLLAHLYHHRMESDAKKVEKYSEESILTAPEKKDCQWLLALSCGHVVWDWNVANHKKAVDFYKQVIAADKIEPPTPMPYYYLIDNLIADNRADEAEEYLERLSRIPAAKQVLIQTYKAYIALARYDEKTGNDIMEKLAKDYPDDGIALFEIAQYYAKKCDYDKAIKYYELSYENEPSKPRFIDAPQAIAAIYEIKGDFKSAAAYAEKVVDCLKNEWKMTEETTLKEAEKAYARLLDIAKSGYDEFKL